MARRRGCSIEFKRSVAQEYLAGESLNGLARRHDVSRNLIRVWIAKYEAGACTSTGQKARPTRRRRTHPEDDLRRQPETPNGNSGSMGSRRSAQAQGLSGCTREGLDVKRLHERLEAAKAMPRDGKRLT